MQLELTSARAGRIALASLVTVLCGVGTGLGAEAAAAAEPIIIPGKVEKVTLYRAEAQVIRTLKVEGGVGQIEVRVPGLPPHVVPDSLYAEASAGIEVRAVRYRAHAVERAPDDDIAALDGQIETSEDALARNARLTQLVAERTAYLNQLEQFVAPTAEVELSRGVLNAETLERLTRFVFEQRTALAEESLRLGREARGIQRDLEVLKARRAELARGATRTEREALLFLEKRAPEPVEVRVGYLVTQAGWSPAYNFHAEGASPVRVEYNAIIYQVTGEDWNDVALILSTAAPGLSAEGPGLAPFRVALGARGQKPQPADYQRQAAAAQERLRAADRGQRAAQDLAGNRANAWALNEAAKDLFTVELSADPDALRALGAEEAIGGAEPSIEYRLGTRVSLASRSDQQLVRVDRLDLPGKPYFVATPALTSYVYREVELTHAGKEALLAGQVNVYLDGRFMGRGEIPTVAPGQTFVMGFGADPQVRARRELIQKTEGVRGGNREVAFQYRLVLENFKAEAVAVRIFDRLPLPENADEVRVTLGALEDKLSEDKLYLRVERPKGILRWDIELPAKAAGEKARLVQYGFTLEFDRTRDLTQPGRPGAPAAAPAARAEFEEMQKQRYGK